MILSQQVKLVVVSGSLLRTYILKMLGQERKISEVVYSALQSLNEAIETQADQDHIDAEVAVVKECGLCRDISKHTISSATE